MNPVFKLVWSLRTYFQLFGVAGVAHRTLMMLSQGNNEFSARIPHSDTKVLIRLGTTDVAAFEHVFIGREYEFSLMGEPSVVVDAGANVGMSAVYFSTRYPQAKIIAIEPDPDNFKILRQNAERFPNILPVNAALWNHNETVAVLDGGAGGWGMRVSSVGSEQNNNAPHPTIRSVRLDTLLEEFGVKQIDLLKVDIEGAEYELFEDASLWIQSVRAICIELHDRFRPGCTEMFESATAQFPKRWRTGELYCVARDNA